MISPTAVGEIIARRAGASSRIDMMKRTGLGFLAAMAACALFLGSCVNGGSPRGAAVGGEYVGRSEGIGPIVATVTVDATGRITDLKLEGPSETPDIGGAALETLKAAVLKEQTAAIDDVSGASYTSKGVKEAVAAALKQAGIDPAREAVPSALSVPSRGGVYEADVLIVGAGTAGTGAALAATERGAKVVVMEKLPKVGGMATTGMGLLATQSSLQKAAGQNVTTEMILKHIAVYNHYRSNLALARVILDKSGDTIDWLMKSGIGLRLGLGIDQKAHLDYPKTYHMWTNSREDFPKVYDMMQRDRGLTLLLNTRGLSLITAEDGTILGVKGKGSDGADVEVRARAVILATGGFGGDPAMLKERTEINDYNYFGFGNLGDGVKMAWSAGADQLGDHVLQIHLGDLAGSKTIFDRFADNGVSQIKDAPLLWVNKEGTRFTDEGVAYDNVLWGNAAYSVGGEYFALVDRASIEDFKKNGIALTGAYQMNGSGLMHPEGGNSTDITIPPLPKLDGDLAALEKEGIVYEGATLADLAAATGMNPRKLEASVARYNAAVAAKKDDLFYKNPAYLLYQVKTGPFYAIRVRGSVYGSIGGVRINEDIQALREDGAPIPGLYVAGADAGGMYDNSYPDLEGLTMSFAMNSGRIAGENAAAYALRN